MRFFLIPIIYILIGLLFSGRIFEAYGLKGTLMFSLIWPKYVFKAIIKGIKTGAFRDIVNEEVNRKKGEPDEEKQD